MSMLQNELKKCGTTIQPVPFNKQPTADSIKRLDSEISSKKFIICTESWYEKQWRKKNESS